MRLRSQVNRLLMLVCLLEIGGALNLAPLGQLVRGSEGQPLPVVVLREGTYRPYFLRFPTHRELTGIHRMSRE